MLNGQGSPSRIMAPNGAPPQTFRGVGQAVIASVDNPTNPKYATILVNNNMPSESLYSIPTGAAPFGPGGSTGFQYFYNNAQMLGGSIVTVDLDAHTILSFTGSVSTSVPTLKYTNVATRTHVGNLSPPLIALVEPIQITPTNNLTGAFPYYVSSLNTITPVLTSGNIISSAFPSMSLSGSLYTQTATTSTSSVGVVLPVGAWLFTDWTSENTGIGDWGPMITDGTNTYQFNISSNTGNLSLFKNGVDIYDVPFSVAASTLAIFVFSITYLGGTSYRLKGWVNGTNQFDYVDGSSSLNPNNIYPGFTCIANQVKHLEMDFCGTTDNPLLLDNPASTTAPVISSPSITYPLAISSSQFYATVTFTVGGAPAPWMEGIRVHYNATYIDIPQTSNNQYSVFLELTGNTAITAAFVDLSGNAGTTASVGSAAYPGVVTGSAGSGTAPTPTEAATQFSYVENVLSVDYDAVANIYLDSNGTTSNTTLAGIELVSAPTGTTSYTTRGTLQPNVSGNYQAIWNDLLNSGTYDLGVRYIDTQGTPGAVYTVGTTAQPPIFIIPMHIPTGIPIAPVIVPSSVVMTPSPLFGEQASSDFQDILAQLGVNNVPQDFSVSRIVWSFRKSAIVSVPPAGPSIVNVTAWTPSGTPTHLTAAFDNTNTYTPAVGNLVLLITKGVIDTGTFTSGWAGASISISLTGLGYAHKVWSGGDTVGETVCSFTSAGTNNDIIVYEIGNVNTTSPIDQVVTGFSSGTHPSPVTCGSGTPNHLAELPIATLGYWTTAGTPSFSNGFIVDEVMVHTGFGASGHGAVTTDTITAITTSATTPGSIRSGSGIIFIRSAGN